jgi:Tol biopolymer transport system component
MAPDGGSATLLVAGREVNSPACSRDGKWVVYESNAGGKSTVWRVSIEGGAAQPLTGKLSRHPVISPDGALVAMYYWDERDDSPRQLVAVPIAGGHPRVVAPIDGDIQFLSWDHDGKGLLLLRHTEQHTDIWRQPIGGGAPTRVTNFADDETHSFALSADGRTLACARGSGWADVVVFRLGAGR